MSIDEEDLPRLILKAPATAKIRGDTERVDTRVVQVIYAVDADEMIPKERKLLVGQIFDVFIDTRGEKKR